MTKREWLDSLGVGSPVGLVKPGVLEAVDVAVVKRVSRVTKTLVVVGDDRFRRRDGNPPGEHHWHRAAYIVPPDSEAFLRKAGEWHLLRLRKQVEDLVREAETDALEAARDALLGW